MPEIGLKIEGIWDEKGGSLAKRKKWGEEEKKGKKGKKERIHDVGMSDGGDGDGKVVSEDMDDGNGELEGEIREEEDELVMDGDDDVANEEEGVNSELVEKGKKKKSGKKGAKANKGKRGVDEEEQNGVGELSEKKTKKQKKMELEAIVASDVTKKSKPKKKKRDDNVVLNDNEQVEVIDELGMEEGMKKKKLKKGKGEEGKRGGAQEGVGEESGESKLSGTKKKKLEKDATVASDGNKKTKSKVVKKGKKSARHGTDQ